MMLRWFRRRPSSTCSLPPPPDSAATVRRLAETQHDLEQTKQQTDYYRGLGSALRAIRRENHLAETFLAAAHAHAQGGQTRD